jgi:hypothetical protein
VENLRIYDRWGGLLFERENIPLNSLEQGWDGKNAPGGQYRFTAKILFPDGGKKRLNGEFFLLR